jgi:outer membrane protein assembly factor BamB
MLDLTPDQQHPYRPRLLLGLLVLAVLLGSLLTLLIAFIQWAQTDQARWFYLGLDGMQWYPFYALGLLVFLFAAFLVFKPKLRTTAILGSGLLLLLFGMSWFIRIESFRGDRTPRFAWKWTPSAEDQVKQYLISNRSRAVSAPSIPYERFAPTASDYPGFMGPDRNGKLVGRNLSKRWQDHPPSLLWRHPVGLGWSSFAIQGSVAVTLEQREENECVVCYDLYSGTELWAYEEPIRFRNEHGDGPRTTPSILGDRVYTCGGTGVICCIDLTTGTLLWKRNLIADASRSPPFFGWSCSPLISGSELIVTPGINPNGTIVALDLETGIERWRGGDDSTSYASPAVASLCGELQYLTFNGEGLRAFAHGGKSLWFAPWITQGDSKVNVAQPIIVDRGGSSANEPARVLISSGYDMGTTLLEVHRFKGEWKVDTVWKSKHLKSKFSNCMIHNDHIYGLDNGLLTCIRLTDGERTWKKGRYGHGQLLMVDGRLLIQCESGEVALVEANPDNHVEVARFQALDDKTWNHPALAGNILVVRNDHEAAAYQLQPVLQIH